MAESDGCTVRSNTTKSRKGKPRGPYNQYLSEPKGKVPRSTLQKWPDKNGARNISSSDLIDESSSFIELDDQREHDHDQSSFLSLVGQIGNCDFSDDKEQVFTDFEELYEKIFQNFPSNQVNTVSSDLDLIETNSCTVEQQDERDSAKDNSQVLYENGVESDDDADEEYFDAFEESEESTKHRDCEHPSAQHQCNEDIIGDLPLYNGAQITVGVSMLLIITFAIRHSLTGQALVDLLTIISLHCSLQNNCASSLELLKKFFMRLKSPIQFHYYCTFCMQYQGLSLANNGLCKNQFCLKNQKEKVNSSYFIIIPLMSQLQDLVQSK